MWTVIYMAQDKGIVDKMKAIIEDSKIITKVRALKKSEENYCYEILVPASEVCDALGLVLETEI